MKAEDKTPGRFYCNFKVHKNHIENEAPPVRPITSGSGSLTEGIATYVEYHLKEISTLHDNYIQDKPHFLRMIEDINKKKIIKHNTLLVTYDVGILFIAKLQIKPK